MKKSQQQPVMPTMSATYAFMKNTQQQQQQPYSPSQGSSSSSILPTTIPAPPQQFAPQLAALICDDLPRVYAVESRRLANKSSPPTETCSVYSYVSRASELSDLRDDVRQTNMRFVQFQQNKNNYSAMFNRLNDNKVSLSCFSF